MRKYTCELEHTMKLTYYVLLPLLSLAVSPMAYSGQQVGLGGPALTSPSEREYSAVESLSSTELVVASADAPDCTAFGNSIGEAQESFSATCPWRSRNFCDPLTEGGWACSTATITNSVNALNDASVESDPLLSSAEPRDEQSLCIAFGATVDDAQSAFSAECPWRIRQACDPVSSGGWACSTQDIDSSSNVFAALTEPSTGANLPPTTATPTGAESGVCTAYGSNQDDVQSAFSAECPWRVRHACTALNSGGWACSTADIVMTNEPSATDNTSAPEDTIASEETAVVDTASVLQIDAESVAFNAAFWEPAEGGLVYLGPSRYLLTSRNDDANLVFNFTVPVAGTYRFTMRSRAGAGPDPAEPPNDLWLKAPGEEWLKVYMSRDGSWQVDAIGERNSTHSRELNTYEFGAGSVEIIVSGRSQGHILDWVALEPQGNIEPVQVNTPVVVSDNSPSTDNVQGTGVMNTTYQPGDLIVIAHDSGPDTDDMQAIVANRMIMDAHPTVNHVLVGATQGHQWRNPTEGSESHTQSLFPDWINAKAGTRGTTSFDGTSVITVADRLESTLSNGGTVHIAEGGPSDFTAEVLRVLQSRGVAGSALKRIRVVQHSAGATAWNQQQTSSANLALVRSAATWVPIANGNVGGNATADFQEPASSAMCQRFMKVVSNSRYASQWAWAYSTIGDTRKCDQSDSVELLYILNDRTTLTFDQFSSRYR